MPGEDRTRRFDYLFEPLDGGDTVEATDDDAVEETDVERSPARTKLTVAALLLASVAATAAIAMLLVRPTSDGRVDTPVKIAPATTATSASAIATTQAAPPPPANPAPVVPPSELPATTTPVVPVPLPTQTAVPPSTPADQPPDTRAPISVEPAPHPPFPDQTPDYGRDQRGGLLGGGGLL
jgi:hypothetical protein